MMVDSNDLFSDVVTLPNATAQRAYNELVGLDDIKTRLSKRARLLLNPRDLETWAQAQHGQPIALMKSLTASAPLFVFAGDVGTGKTALAESFGDDVARRAGIEVMLYRMSLNSRGSGAVGEMTRLLTSAFDQVIAAAKAQQGRNGQARGGTILLIDEADALAQSRELSQMHHEDRAGVNALIRGVDELRKCGGPAIVVMCTNRLESIDPAVRRRAAEVFGFHRPGPAQRLSVFKQNLGDLEFNGEQLQELVDLTGSQDHHPGFTYSDLRHRLLPSILIEAYPDQAVTYDLIREVTVRTKPTPPFQDERVGIMSTEEDINA